MLIQIRNINISPLQHGNTSRSLVHNPAPDLSIFNLRQNKGFQPLSRYTTLQRRDNITRYVRFVTRFEFEKKKLQSIYVFHEYIGIPDLITLTSLQLNFVT